MAFLLLEVVAQAGTPLAAMLWPASVAFGISHSRETLILTIFFSKRTSWTCVEAEAMECGVLCTDHQGSDARFTLANWDTWGHHVILPCLNFYTCKRKIRASLVVWW